MKIQVTQQDIDNGLPKDSRACALALALKRHDPRFISCLMFNACTVRGIIKLPEKASNFVSRFDCGLSVQPFEFELEEL